MMDKEKYMQKVAAGLHRLPEADRNEILTEIANHIHEAQSRQEPIEQVLTKLGSPLALAQSYASIYNIENREMSLKYIINNIAFYFSAGISGCFIIPSLFIMALTFPLASLAAVGAAIADIIFDLPIEGTVNLGPNIILSGFPALIATLVICIPLSLLGLLCWKGLKKYLRFVSMRYQKLKMNK